MHKKNFEVEKDPYCNENGMLDEGGMKRPD
jgi:hypothetical protein